MGVSVTQVTMMCALWCWIPTVTSEQLSPPYTLPLSPPYSPLLPIQSPNVQPIPILLALLQDALGKDIGDLSSLGTSYDPAVEAGMVTAGQEREEDEEREGQREKRVFLSRGWGPGGYETPPPPPTTRFVRRPAASLTRPIRPRPIVQALQDKSVMGVRFAPLVSMKEETDQSSSPAYRRFHSIFTSGTWSPLGKRAIVPVSGPREVPLSGPRQWDEDMQDIVNIEIRNEDKVEKNQQQVEFKLGEEMRYPEQKRGGVFSSHGWGPGGLSTPRRSQWVAIVPKYPAIAPKRKGGVSRHTTHFRPTEQRTKPLYHLFVSNGWGPMGR